MRLTLFIADPTFNTSIVSLWSQIAKSEPDVQTTQKTAPRVHVHGPIDGQSCIFSLDAQPGRVDLSLSTLIPNDAKLENFPSFGTWSKGVEVYCQLFLPWISSAPSVSRMAFGTLVTAAMPDRVTGYQHLQRYLGFVKLDPAGSSDFSYSINRPRPSQTDAGITINRLSKWSVAALSNFEIEFAPGTTQVFGQLQTEPGLHASRVELDINTAGAMRTALSGDKAAKILSELIDFSAEILAKGDVP